MAKKEISNSLFIGVIVMVVLVLGTFLYRKATVNPPTPRPDPKYFGGVPAAPTR
jgi:hypothetical protein